jgi:hypothetical protein
MSMQHTTDDQLLTTVTSRQYAERSSLSLHGSALSLLLMARPGTTSVESSLQRPKAQLLHLSLARP